MSDSRANDLIGRYERLAAERSVLDNHWQRIAELIYIHAATFNGKSTPGTTRTEHAFDSTAALALERFSATMESMLCPRTQKWHTLIPVDDDLYEDEETKRYLDKVRDIMFQRRYAPRANFASQQNEIYMSLGAFGTGCKYIDEIPGYGPRFKSIHLSEIVIDENYSGTIDTVKRKFPLTARQAVQKWPKGLPERVTKCAESDKDKDKEFDFLHCVLPREDAAYGRMDYAGMPWASYYVCVEGQTTIEEGGYWEMPYAVSRYVTFPREKYGRSPAMTVLADIKMINAMSKTTIRTAELQADPVLLAPDDGSLSAFHMRPGAINYGGVDSQGNQLIKPLQTGAKLDISLEMQDQRRATINDSFLVTIFRVLIENPNMTATQALILAQEKGALLAPTMGRSQSEDLGPQIKRELGILTRMGMIPEMPRKLLDRGGQIKVEYQSPLARLQRAEEAMGLARTIESVTPIAQVDPSVLDSFDPEGVVKVFSEANGVPTKALRSKGAIEALKRQRAATAQAEAVLAAAPVAGQTARDLAMAQKEAGAAVF